MTESGVTMHSDSERYSAGDDTSPSPESSSSPALLLYQPPTLFSLIRGAAINLFLPFINGMMLGFGELFAHEAAFRLGWSGTRVSSIPRKLPVKLRVEGDIVWVHMRVTDKNPTRIQVFPASRRQRHPIGPGIEIRDKPRMQPSIDDLACLE
jgi:hypothetical protein